MDRVSIRKTSYKPPRGLKLEESDSLLSINALLKPWGFRLAYYGYDKISMEYVYQFVTTKDEYASVHPSLVMLYHHADMTEEEWLGELKHRLMKMGKQNYDTAWARYNRVMKNRSKNHQYKRRRKPSGKLRQTSTTQKGGTFSKDDAL